MFRLSNHWGQCMTKKQKTGRDQIFVHDIDLASDVRGQSTRLQALLLWRYVPVLAGRRGALSTCPRWWSYEDTTSLWPWWRPWIPKKWVVAGERGPISGIQVTQRLRTSKGPPAISDAGSRDGWRGVVTSIVHIGDVAVVNLAFLQNFSILLASWLHFIHKFKQQMKNIISDFKYYYLRIV